MLTPWKESYDQVRWHIKKQRHYFSNKGPSSQSYGFSSSHVWMLELDYKESWVPKNWCFWIVVLEKTLESPLDCKDIHPVHSEGDQPWVGIGGTDAKAETPILWPPDAKSWLIWKDPNGGKDWRWEEKGTTENEMVGWHHQLNGREFEYTPGVGDGQGGLEYHSPWRHRVGHDWAIELNWQVTCVFFGQTHLIAIGDISELSSLAAVIMVAWVDMEMERWTITWRTRTWVESRDV